MPGSLALPAQDPQRAEALGGTVHPQGRELGPGGLKPSQAVLCPALLSQQEPPPAGTYLLQIAIQRTSSSLGPSRAEQGSPSPFSAPKAPPALPQPRCTLPSLLLLPPGRGWGAAGGCWS